MPNKINLIGQQFGRLTVIEPAENKGKRTQWKCKCDCGNITYVDSNNLVALHTLSCGCINSSIGVDNIVKLLKENNISFIKEYTLKDVKDKKPFRLDFMIIDNDNKPLRAIEYDGIQHYKETWGAWSNRITLVQQQERDKRKNQWCKDNNIPLVRIPYWERDNITLDMLLGDKYLIQN